MKLEPFTSDSRNHISVWEKPARLIAAARVTSLHRQLARQRTELEAEPRAHRHYCAGPANGSG